MIRGAVAAAAAALLAGCATAGDPDAALPTRGYLDPATTEALARAFAAPPPAPALRPADRPGVGPGSDRWWLATAHAELRPPEAAQHFDCILGTRLTEAPRPALTRLMGRLLVDAAAVAGRLGELHPRTRPVAVDRDLQPCERITSAVRDSPSWPAAGAVAAAAWSEAFAALALDRAEAARARGAEIGASRAICRMNWPGDVEDGLRLGAGVYAAAARAPDFRTDLEAARAEVAAARAEGLDNPSCAAERRALGPTPDAD